VRLPYLCAASEMNFKLGTLLLLIHAAVGQQADSSTTTLETNKVLASTPTIETSSRNSDASQCTVDTSTIFASEIQSTSTPVTISTRIIGYIDVRSITWDLNKKLTWRRCPPRSLPTPSALPHGKDTSRVR
jgi:hypothetical protein